MKQALILYRVNGLLRKCHSIKINGTVSLPVFRKVAKMVTSNHTFEKVTITYHTKWNKFSSQTKVTFS